jgi:hypothetical protein
MASVSNLTLSIAVVNNGANLEANIDVEYDIVFNSYDQNSNQAYAETCKIIGDDTGIVPAEDGVDDAILNGTLFPAFPFPGLNLVASNGQASVHRTRSKTLPLNNLNEDLAGNPDELRAVVTLSPVLPVAVSRESAQVALNI